MKIWYRKSYCDAETKGKAGIHLGKARLISESTCDIHGESQILIKIMLIAKIKHMKIRPLSLLLNRTTLRFVLGQRGICFGKPQLSHYHLRLGFSLRSALRLRLEASLLAHGANRWKWKRSFHAEGRRPKVDWPTDSQHKPAWSRPWTAKLSTWYRVSGPKAFGLGPNLTYLHRRMKIVRAQAGSFACAKMRALRSSARRRAWCVHTCAVRRTACLRSVPEATK